MGYIPPLMRLGLLLLGALLSVPTWANRGGFLHIDGINGTATEAEHTGWIRLLSFSWEELKELDGTRLDYGIPAPASGPGVLIVTKPFADSIPDLKRYCSEREEPLAEVTLSHPRYSWRGAPGPSSSGQDLRDVFPPFLNFKLKNVTVPKCLHVEGAEGEVFWLRFDDIQWLNAKPPASVPPP